METYFSFLKKVPARHAEGIIQQMTELIRDEKPLQAIIVFCNCGNKTKEKIKSILRVKTKNGIINKLSINPTKRKKTKP